MSNKEIYQSFVVNSAIYKTLITKKFANRVNWVKPDENKILSFIPGTIVSIVAKEGQMLKEGESILILEAMKMLNDVNMPFDGKVVKIHVSIGEKLPKNTMMVEIERK